MMLSILGTIGIMIYYQYNPPRHNPMPGLPKDKPPALIAKL